MVFAPDGTFLRASGEEQVFDPRSITIDGDDRALLIGRDAHQVRCFSPEGALLFSLGERHRPQ